MEFLEIDVNLGRFLVTVLRCGDDNYTNKTNNFQTIIIQKGFIKDHHTIQ